MGKLEVEAGVIVEELPTTNTLPCCCRKSTWRWLLPVVLGIYVLAFALWLFIFRGSSRSDSSAPSSPMPYIEASFRLSRPITAVHESLQKLQVDLQDEIRIPDAQIDIVSIVPLYSSNGTEVRFTVSPDRLNDSIAPAEMILLKETFVELFMQRAANLSLTDDVFGNVSHFEVLRFPGGITVVPDQPGLTLFKVVLFNFTLNDSLSNVTCNFAEFKKQLASGIILKPNESLFVRLTNLDGSTLKPPLIVQTSILPMVGIMLPAPRLKQLAQAIVGSTSKNLGLNDTFFGRVQEVNLSSYLQYILEPAQSPSWSPSPAPSVSDCPQSPQHSTWGGRLRGCQSHSPIMAPSYPPYFHTVTAPASEGPVGGRCRHHHHRGVFGPLAPVPARPPLQSISPTPPYAGPLSGPLESHEMHAFVTVASPSSSAVILGIPSWAIAVPMMVLTGIIC